MKGTAQRSAASELTWPSARCQAGRWSAFWAGMWSCCVSSPACAAKAWPYCDASPAPQSASRAAADPPAHTEGTSCYTASMLSALVTLHHLHVVNSDHATLPLCCQLWSHSTSMLLALVMLHCHHAVSSGHITPPPSCRLWSCYTSSRCQLWSCFTAIMLSALVIVTHCPHAVKVSSGQWYMVTMLSQPVLVSVTHCHSQLWSVWHTATASSGQCDTLSQPALVSVTHCYSQLWSVWHTVTASSGQPALVSVTHCHSQLWSA